MIIYHLFPLSFEMAERCDFDFVRETIVTNFEILLNRAVLIQNLCKYFRNLL